MNIVSLFGMCVFLLSSTANQFFFFICSFIFCLTFALQSVLLSNFNV